MEPRLLDISKRLCVGATSVRLIVIAREDQLISPTLLTQAGVNFVGRFFAGSGDEEDTR